MGLSLNLKKVVEFEDGEKREKVKRMRGGGKDILIYIDRNKGRKIIIKMDLWDTG